MCAQVVSASVIKQRKSRLNIALGTGDNNVLWNVHFQLLCLFLWKLYQYMYNECIILNNLYNSQEKCHKYTIFWRATLLPYKVFLENDNGNIYIDFLSDIY
jgi:hypothetical protein